MTRGHRGSRHEGGMPLVALTCAIVCVMAVGCQRPSRAFLNENDRLRRENLLLAERVGELEAALERRVRQVRAMESRRQGPPAAELAGVDTEGADSEGVDAAADIPMLSELRLGRYSGPVDSNDDGRIDAVRLYVQTRDQKGRFLPTAATAAGQVVLMQPDREPRVLGRARWTLAQFEAAYRSGFLGTHYRLDLPLTDPDAVEELAGRTVTVQLALTDAATGATIDVQRTFELP
jgi:hypothetical protein